MRSNTFTPATSEGKSFIGMATASADTDGDGVDDSVDVCPGYNDTDDWDKDGIPSGCETKIIVGGAGYIQGFSTDSNTAITKNYLWRTKANSASAGSSTGVTVSDGVVYGGGDNLYALDADTGTQQWVFNDIGIITGQPTVANGVVYVGDRSYNVYAVTTSGTKVWKYTTKGYVLTQSAVADGIVYFGSQDKYLYAVDASTGTLKWNYNTGTGVQSSPAVANGLVYVGGNDSTLYALSASTGTQVWKKRFADYGKYVSSAGSIGSDPYVKDGVVYVSGNKYAGSYVYTYSVYALDADDGALLWSYDVNTKGLRSPVVLDGVLYITGDDGYLYALDASTGAYKWKLSVTAKGGKAILYDGLVYIGTDSGQLWAITPSTGTKKWYGYIGSSASVYGIAVSTD